MNLEWGRTHAEKLWHGLYARYNPIIANRTILDFGCSWGYMLKYLLDTDKPKQLIGVDVRDLWSAMKPVWDYENAVYPLTFLEEDIRKNTSIAEASLDVILCTSVLQYMPPDMLESTLDKLFTLLKPGGEFLLRTRCFTSYIGADLHTQFSLPYIHLLYPGRETSAAYREQAGRMPRYLNNLTASSYVALFQRCGFEIMDLTRRMNTRDPDIMKKVAEKWPWISPEELNVTDVEARLLRPMRAEQLNDFGQMAKSIPWQKGVSIA